MDGSLSYEKGLQWIHGLGRFGIKPGLERITALLELLGNPHQKLRFVHIGGTNGKGSTAAMLASMMRAAGYRVGLYTSPYLLSFTNRMAVDGVDIDHEGLTALVRKVRPLVDRVRTAQGMGEMTEFEVVTALAFEYFAQEKPDLVVLEVGLGGRLDATNVVDPLIAVITNISLEHTAVLGTTIEDIAAEKAGIIKAGKALVTAAEEADALRVFEERCLELDAPFYRLHPTMNREDLQDLVKPAAVLNKITLGGQFFSYHGIARDLDNLFTSLRGKYQVSNAATALVALELIEPFGYRVSEDAVRRGLADTTWPGRLELLQEEPLLIMDGAHNPAAVKELSTALRQYFAFEELVLVIGILGDKDIAAMLEHILPLAQKIIFTRPVVERAADPHEVAAFAVKNLNLDGEYLVIEDYRKALEKAINLAGPKDAVLVTGSLYTVSDIRAAYQQGRL